MSPLVFALVVLLVIIIAAVLALKAKAMQKAGEEKSAKPDAYYLRKSLFSPAERSFSGVLDLLELEGVTIASKVRLADIFGVKKGLERGDRQRAQNRINAKHVDFLLVQKSDARPLLGIDLDDRSHEDEERAARDSFVDEVFASAGLPILHVPAKAAYDPKEIRRQIDEALSNVATALRPVS